MAVIVHLKNKATGEVTTHFSVDAAEILPRGEHEQVGGLPVKFTPLAPPAEPEQEPQPEPAQEAPAKPAKVKK